MMRGLVYSYVMHLWVLHKMALASLTLYRWSVLLPVGTLSVLYDSPAGLVWVCSYTSWNVLSTSSGQTDHLSNTIKSICKCTKPGRLFILLSRCLHRQLFSLSSLWHLLIPLKMSTHSLTRTLRTFVNFEVVPFRDLEYKNVHICFGNANVNVYPRVRCYVVTDKVMEIAFGIHWKWHLQAIQ